MKHQSPTAAEVRELRKRLLLNQTQFGQWLKCSMRSVQQWEAGERVMHPGLWELANLKEKFDVRT
jgi:DNA-binding transcriptional regulator YiaG